MIEKNNRCRTLTHIWWLTPSRQSGHVLLCSIHLVMQSLWNWWEQGSLEDLSSSSISSKQTLHSGSSSLCWLQGGGVWALPGSAWFWSTVELFLSVFWTLLELWSSCSSGQRAHIKVLDSLIWCIGESWPAKTMMFSKLEMLPSCLMLKTHSKSYFFTFNLFFICVKSQRWP